MKHITESDCEKLIGHCWTSYSSLHEDKPKERICGHCKRREIEVSTWEEQPKEA